MRVSCKFESQTDSVDLNEEAMSSNRTFVLAPAVTTVAAGLAIQRRTRAQEANRDRTQLQTWENEGGNAKASDVVQAPSSSSH